MECVERLRKAERGPISVLGMDPRKDIADRQARIGVQHQEAHLQKRIKVWEAVGLWADLYEKSVDPDELLHRLGLEEKRDSLVHEPVRRSEPERRESSRTYRTAPCTP